MNSITASLWILVLIALVSLGSVAYCVVTGHTIPDVIMGLLGVVLGFLGNHLASAQGATQALLQPPKPPVQPSVQPPVQPPTTAI